MFFLALKVIIWKQALYLLVGSGGGKGKMEREGNWALRNVVNKYLWAVTKMTVRKFSDELSKKCSLLFRGLQLFKSTLASESSHNSQYWQMVLKTRAGNQHGFDPLLPLQALSVHALWVNYLSSHRRNPGFWCSSLSQDMVRNRTWFWGL